MTTEEAAGFGHGVQQARFGIATSAVMTLALAGVGVSAPRDAWAALVPALLFSAATIRQTAWLAHGYRPDAIVYWSRSWTFFAAWLPALFIAYVVCFVDFEQRALSHHVLGCTLMSMMAMLFLQPFAIVVDGAGRFVCESCFVGSKKHAISK